MPTTTGEELAVQPQVEQAESASSPVECTDWSNSRTRAGVRVSVNLQQFFTDHRARAFMWAPYGRCAQWLSRRIARVFELPDDIALMCQGHLLPSTEPLLMLERDDTVKVVKTSFVYTQHNKQDDPIMTTQNKNDISPIKRRQGENTHPTRSNMIINHTITSPLPSNDNNIEEHKNMSGIEYRTDSTDTIDNRETANRVPESQSMDINEDLQRLKQRALRLLDEHCHMLQEVPPKRVRRRRRRRRPASVPSDDETQTVQHSDVIPTSEDNSSTIIRNGSGSRPPRIVHALSPLTTLQ